MNNLFQNFLKSAEIDAWIFVFFLSQVQKFATLSILSTVRQHNAQALMNVRQMFESGVLAAYALIEKDISAYYYEDKYKCACEKKGIRNKAYNWLKENYKSHSDTIKNQKNIINNMWTHSSILLTLLNSDISEDKKFINSIFDKEDDVITKNQLWFIANSCWGLMDLYAKLINTTKMAKLSDDFWVKMKQFGDENELLKKELMQDPRIQKWAKIINSK